MTAVAIKIFTFAVGRRYRCRLSLPARFRPGTAMRATCEWSPCLPVKLTADEQQDFAAGRDRAFAAVLGPEQHGAMLELDAVTARLTVIAHEHDGEDHRDA